MTKPKKVNQDSEEVARLKRELHDTIKRERTARKVEVAKSTLAQHEQEYEQAKTVFFQVNGARRILKNA